MVHHVTSSEADQNGGLCSRMKEIADKLCNTFTTGAGLGTRGLKADVTF